MFLLPNSDSGDALSSRRHTATPPGTERQSSRGSADCTRARPRNRRTLCVSSNEILCPCPNTFGKQFTLGMSSQPVFQCFHRVNRLHLWPYVAKRELLSLLEFCGSPVCTEQAHSPPTSVSFFKSFWLKFVGCTGYGFRWR